MRSVLSPGATRRLSLGPWLASAALCLPLLALYGAHFARPGGTGFLFYDGLYYMANAREHFDAGFGLTYGNPCSPDPATPRIYFHLHLLLLGIAWKVTGLAPGLVFAAAGGLAALVGIRLALALLAEHVPLGDGPGRATATCFVWGGGLLSAVGWLRAVATADRTPEAWLALDPGGSWWFLNLGRNFVYPNEGIYHALALGFAVLASRGRMAAALVTLGALALCHPFTGVQFLLIALAWMVVERRAGSMPVWAIAAGGAMLAAHLCYYLVFLPADPEHHSVQSQFVVLWGVSFVSQLLAYGPVLLLAAFACRSAGGVRPWLASPARRLLAVWLLVSLGLINHDLLLPPHQPAHFTRGYVWSPAFLLGAPALRTLLAATVRRQRLFSLALAGALLCDNATWFAYRTFTPTGCYDPPPVRAVLKALNADPALGEGLFISDQPILGYAVVTCTPLRAWFSHYAVTPHAEERKRELLEFWAHGVAPPAWSGRLLVLAASPQRIASRAGLLEAPRRVVRTDRYEVVVGYLRRSPG